MKAIATAFVAVWISAAASSISAQTAADKEKAALASIEAVSAFDNGLWDVAITRASTCLLLDPTSWGCFMTRGRSYYQRIPDEVLTGASPMEQNEDWKRSIADLTKAIELAPQTSLFVLHMDRGDVYGWGSTPEAVMLGVKDVERALQIASDDQEAKDLLADLRQSHADRLVRRGDKKYDEALALDAARRGADAAKVYQEALADLTLALDHAAPDDLFTALFLRAQLYRTLGETQRIIPDLDRALQAQPQQLGARLLRAQTHAAQGNDAAAVADFSFVIASEDADAMKFKTPAYSGRGALHYDAQRFGAAIADYDKYLATNPNDEDVGVMRAVAMHKLGQVAPAEAELRRLIRASKDPQMIILFVATEGVRFNVDPGAPTTASVPPAAPAAPAPVTAPASVPTAPPTSATTVLFADEFDDNRSSWGLGDNATASAFMVAGQQVIEVKQPVLQKTWLNGPVFERIDQSKDFSIEAAITFISGVEDQGYGVIWGVQSVNDLFEFSVSASGSFRYGRWVAGAWQPGMQEQPHAAVRKGPGSTNKLTVRKRGESLELYVNDALVGTQRYERFTTPGLGFAINHQKRIAVDYIRVTQPF